MNILSWNIFANNSMLEKRIQIICDKILDIDPDVICLQEVIPFTWNIICDKLLTKYNSLYSNPYVNNSSLRIFGESILIKKDIKIINKSFVKLPSKQGRILTYTELCFKNKKIIIGTSHLESFKENESIRSTQIDFIKDIMFKDNSNIIWIGDSNINSKECRKYDFLLSGNDDTYHNDRFGTTNYSEKYDKIWISGCELKSIDNIVAGEPSMWLSDHDGIHVKIIL